MTNIMVLLISETKLHCQNRTCCRLEVFQELIAFVHNSLFQVSLEAVQKNSAEY